jgi:hypothetical protein
MKPMTAEWATKTEGDFAVTHQYRITCELMNRLRKGGSLKRSLGMVIPAIPKAFGFEAATQC